MGLRLGLEAMTSSPTHLSTSGHADEQIRGALLQRRLATVRVVGEHLASHIQQHVGVGLPPQWSSRPESTTCVVDSAVSAQLEAHPPPVQWQCASPECPPPEKQSCFFSPTAHGLRFHVAALSVVGGWMVLEKTGWKLHPLLMLWLCSSLKPHFSRVVVAVVIGLPWSTS